MQALIVAIGSHGDIHPMIGIGAELRRRGHSVTFVASPYFESLARRHRFDFAPLGKSEDFSEGLKDPDLWHPIRGFKAVFEGGVLPLVRPTYDAIAQRYVPGQTIVIAHSIAFGARLAQDALGVPTITIQLAPAVFRSVHEAPKLPGLFMPRWMPKPIKRMNWWLIDTLVADRLLAPPINAMRKELDLPPVKGILNEWWLSPQLVLGLFPEWFAKPQPDWPKQLKLTTFPLYDEDDVEPISRQLDVWVSMGERPIVFTPGSAMTFGQDFFRESVEVCKRLNKRGILLSRHREHIPPNLPATVQHFDYVPFSRILPRAAALVHHGGIGTTSQALAAGCPQLIMPMAHDQRDNAHHVADLRAGDWIKRSRYRAKDVALALAKLVNNPVVKHHCERAAGNFVGVKPMGRTCDEIELFALTTPPRAAAHRASTANAPSPVIRAST
jgi:UDP:flavonoid glycosyltransferase YjiC (YdhE family)